MTGCRVCGALLGAPAYEAPAPALTSALSTVPMSTRVHLCATCGHGQSPDLPDLSAYYDRDYRISLASADHDQIVGVTAAGVPVFRTDRQAAVTLDLLHLPLGAAILDYGAAKASTLKRMCAARPDLRPHAFDVSNDYRAAWDGWIRPEDQATYTLPALWSGRFQAVMAHFVLEHVADPVGFLATLRDLLTHDGRLVVSVPDPAANSGDMMVADHLSHFSEASLRHALERAGLAVDAIDDTVFPGALMAIARRAARARLDRPDPAAALAAHAAAAERCAFWQDAAGRLERAARRLEGSPAVIYGAGFYGSWIHARIRDRVPVTAFLDQNPHLDGSAHLGTPVVAPDAWDGSADVVFVGLNPARARAILADVPALSRSGLAFVFLS